MNGFDSNLLFNQESNYSDFKALLQQLTEKDKLIEALQSQISDLTKQLSEQSTQIGLLNTNNQKKRSFRESDSLPRGQNTKSRRTKNNAGIKSFLLPLNKTGINEHNLNHTDTCVTNNITPTSNIIDDSSELDNVDMDGADTACSIKSNNNISLCRNRLDQTNQSNANPIGHCRPRCRREHSRAYQNQRR